jgi:hypothetical protein
MIVFIVCREDYVEQGDLSCKNRVANQTKKKINQSYIAVLQIRKKILLSVAIIVHMLQQLDDSNPNRNCPLQRMCTDHNFKFLAIESVATDDDPLQRLRGENFLVVFG